MAKPTKKGNKDDKLVISVSEQKKPSAFSLGKNKNLLIAFAILAFVFILAAKIDVKTSTYVIKEPITGKHKVIERMPYEAYEPYYVVEEYEDKVPFGRRDCAPRAMNFTPTFLPMTITSDKTAECTLYVRNIENATGTWGYRAELVSANQRYFAPAKTVLVPPLTERPLTFTFDIPDSEGGLNCQYFPESIPSMTKCFYAEPISYMTVKKTRTVERNKTIIKYQEIERITNETTYTNSEKTLTVVSVFGIEIFRFG